MPEYTEPTWPTESQEVEKDPKSTCFIRDPYILTGLFIQFTRSHFADADNIINDKFKGYIWDTTADSKIKIDAAYKWDPTHVQQRPSIFIKREAVQVNDKYNLGHGKHLSHVNLNGSHTGADYSLFVQGGHTIICVGQTAAEAENLGFEVFFKYLQYRDVLKKEGNLGSLNIAGIGPVQKVDENKENWSVTISLSWIYAHEWTLYQEAPILKKVVFTPDF
jgi:hypothetical protein